MDSTKCKIKTSIILVYSNVVNNLLKLKILALLKNNRH